MDSAGEQSYISKMKIKNTVLRVDILVCSKMNKFMNKKATQSFESPNIAMVGVLMAFSKSTIFIVDAWKEYS